MFEWTLRQVQWMEVNQVPYPGKAEVQAVSLRKEWHWKDQKSKIGCPQKSLLHKVRSESETTGIELRLQEAQWWCKPLGNWYLVLDKK